MSQAKHRGLVTTKLSVLHCSSEHLNTGKSAHILIVAALEDSIVTNGKRQKLKPMFLAQLRVIFANFLKKIDPTKVQKM